MSVVFTCRYGDDCDIRNVHLLGAVGMENRRLPSCIDNCIKH